MEAYLIGTLYEEEEKEKKQNFYNQIARDEKGHKRFHGAFTGGFSAGYKNTCGSKEGWVPSQFVSSRSNRAQYKPQSILQFMDEEDLGQTIGGQNLITHEGFSDTFGNKAQEQENVAFEQMKQVLGVEIPKELVISTKKDSVGMTILKNMKQFSNNTNSNHTKIIGAQPPEKKPEFDPIKIISYKDDFQGVGEENAGEIEENDWFSEQLSVFMRSKRQGKQENQQQENETEEKKQKNILKFTDFTENNEKEDYNDFEITHEDMEAIHEFYKERKQINKIKDVLGLYEKSLKPYILPLHKNTIKIPPDYNAFYRLTQKPQEIPGLSLLSSSRSRLTIDQRAALLEESAANSSSVAKTINMNKPLKQISEEKKRKILGVKQFVKGSAQDMEGDHIENIFKDKDKQARYLNFCYEKEGKVVGGIPPNSSLSLEQLQNETKEFEQIYELFKNYKKEEFAEKNKEKPAIEHRRSFQQWVPEKLTCKRFGVAQPFQGKLAPLNQQKALIQRRNVFETEIRPLFENSGKRTFEETGIEENEEVEGEIPLKKIKGETEEQEKVAQEGPSLELFKSIFDAEDDE